MKFFLKNIYCIFGLYILFTTQNVFASGIADSTSKIKTHYHLSFNGNYSKNSAEQFLLITDNSITLQKGPLAFTQLLTYHYSTLKSAPTVPTINLLNETLTTSKLSYQINKINPFVLFGFENSNIRSIKTRYYGIVGLDYKLINKKSNHVSPLFGISSEFADYKNDSEYNSYFLVFGIRGYHDHAQNKLRIQYNGYFFKRATKNQWRYQGTLTAMIQIIKPIYATVNVNLLEENILGPTSLQKISTISFGFTYRG